MHEIYLADIKVPDWSLGVIAFVRAGLSIKILIEL